MDDPREQLAFLREVAKRSERVRVEVIGTTEQAVQVGKGARAAGYTVDEYGLLKAGPQEVARIAGDEDEGICRNAVGLRHHLGILVESAVTADPRNTPVELVSRAADPPRREPDATAVRTTRRRLRSSLFPPPAAYLLSTQQAGEIADQLRLHGIAGRRVGSDIRIDMGQRAEPV